MANTDLERELQLLRDRVVRLEREVFSGHGVSIPRADARPAGASPATATHAPGPAAAAAIATRPTPARAPGVPQAPPVPLISKKPGGLPATPAISLLGAAGAAAFVLAAAYLIRLAIDAGVLTPAVQVASAVLFGVVLIAVGVALRKKEHSYAGLLPAAGIAVLYAATYGARVFYQLIGPQAADAVVVLVGAAALWLCVLFDSEGYALFAIAGSYAAPLLMRGQTSGLDGLAVYFSVWSLTFTAFAVARRRRLVYLVALYAALYSFDALAHPQSQDWQLLVGFQAVQFVIFGVGAAVFTAVHGEPLDEEQALWHLPALLVFYALEYFVLKAHVPALAPMIAFASLGLLVLICGAVRLWLPRVAAPGSRFLMVAYGALVVFHAGYLETVPAAWAPWVAAAVFVIAAVTLRRWVAIGLGAWAIGFAVGAMFALNLLNVLLDENSSAVPGWPLVGVVYAALLYGAFAVARKWKEQSDLAQGLLYLGQLTAMVVAVHLVHDRILQSMTWGLIALATLAAALLLRDERLSKSSLVVFGATGLKVILMDLQGSAPIARVISLFILGVTFYVGGLLYRRLSARTDCN